MAQPLGNISCTSSIKANRRCPGLLLCKSLLFFNGRHTDKTPGAYTKLEYQHVLSCTTNSLSSHTHACTVFICAYIPNLKSPIPPPFFSFSLLGKMKAFLLLNHLQIYI
uniref:Uncharacterized protein n=1 Tax=Sphaerodactylus townsendi TaxID=933632 RepID=A0ACB8G1A5_9SAUR